MSYDIESMPVKFEEDSSVERASNEQNEQPYITPTRASESDAIFDFEYASTKKRNKKSK